MGNENYPEALAILQEAAASPDKSPYDQHVITVLAGAAYARTNDYVDAGKAFDK